MIQRANSRRSAPALTPPSPPPPAAPQIEPSQGAVFLRDSYATSVLASIAPNTVQAVGIQSVAAYRAELLGDCNGPRDGLERMLLDQLLWAHHRLAGLMADSTGTQNPEQVQLYINAAARLMAESRKSMLALKEYRAPARQPANLTVVAGNQVALVDGSVGNRPAEENFSNTELVGNPQITHVVETDRIIPESAVRNGQRHQPSAASRN